MADFTLFNQFTWIYPEYLLGLIPLALLLPWLKQNAQKTGLIAPHLAKLLSVGNQTTKKNKWALPTLASAWLIAVIALAGPSFEKADLPAFGISGARVLVMDMSRSMYAIDISPDRLSQARYKALDLLPGWQEGSTGLVAYSGDAYTVSPLTEDASTLASLIPSLSPAIMPFQGSNAGAGIQQAIDLMTQAGFPQGDIVLITDGLSQKESQAVLRLVEDQEFRVSILAVGTQEGGPIQLPEGGMLENHGNLVIAQLSLETLSPITQQTGGVLQTWQPTNRDVQAILARTEKPIESGDGKNKEAIQEQVNAGFWLMIPLALLALFGFRKGAIMALMMVILPPPPLSLRLLKIKINWVMKPSKPVILSKQPARFVRLNGKALPNTKQEITKGRLIRYRIYKIPPRSTIWATLMLKREI